MAQLKGNSKVYGDLTVDGILTVNSIDMGASKLNGTSIVGSSLSISGITTLGGLVIRPQASGGTIVTSTNVSGIITYYGDGRYLTDIVAIAKPEGVNGEVQYNDNGALDGASHFFYDKTNIRVGIGTSLPTARLSIANTSTGQSLMLVTDNNEDGTIFRVNDKVASPVLDIDASGTILFSTSNNMGIGPLGGTAIPNPSARLHVDGTLKVDGLAQFANINAGVITASLLSAPLDSASITIPGVTGEVQYKNANGRLGGASYFFYDSTNLRVGIGTSLPSSRLSIANPTQGDSLLLVNDNVSDGSQFRVNDSLGRPLFDVDGDGTVLFLTSGNIGIGSTIVTPTSKLQVDGDLRVGKNQSNGVILTSPNGTKYRMIVDNAGTVTTTLVP